MTEWKQCPIDLDKLSEDLLDYILDMDFELEKDGYDCYISGYQNRDNSKGFLMKWLKKKLGEKNV